MPPPVIPRKTLHLSAKMSELSENYRCFPIVGDLGSPDNDFERYSGVARHLLKGGEASGFVSGETTLVLFSAFKNAASQLKVSGHPRLGGRLPPRGLQPHFCPQGPAGSSLRAFTG